MIIQSIKYLKRNKIQFSSINLSYEDSTKMNNDSKNDINTALQEMIFKGEIDAYIKRKGVMDDNRTSSH